MKTSLMNKVLIGAISLTSCQKPIQNITYQQIAPVKIAVDTFTPSKINPEKTFDILKNIAEFFTDGINFAQVKTASKPSKKLKVKPKSKKAVSSAKSKKANNVKPRRPVQKENPVIPIQRKISSTLDGKSYWITGKNISYGAPGEYTVPKGSSQKGISIAGANGVSLYRLKIANPDIDFSKPVPSGVTLKIPGRYIVNPGSVKNFDDVVRTTRIDKHYIKDILVGIEGRKQKPDLVCKSDKVRSKEYPNGCPTIGFGHTGRINGKQIVNGKTRITEAQAYEILAQDILDAKLDALVYMGKPLFNSAPESVQTGIIDIVFNKGVEPFTRAGSPTTLIKHDLETKNYVAAAAHTVLKTGNRGLKKRNVYRVIMSTTDLSQSDKNKSLAMAKPHYLETLRRFPGNKGKHERGLMQKAWDNVKHGKTWGFFGN